MTSDRDRRRGRERPRRPSRQSDSRDDADSHRDLDSRGAGRREADPHAGGPLVTAGGPSGATEVAVVLLHGRGATADGIVRLAEPLYRRGVTFYAPGTDSSGYPYPFLAPVERNEPYLSPALRRAGSVVETVAETVPLERVVVGGVSQEACLAAEFAARRPRRYGGVFALSGGLVGPPDRLEAHGYGGSLDGTPVFLGRGDVDEHVIVERAEDLGGPVNPLDDDVIERVYAGLGHEVNDEEFQSVGGSSTTSWRRGELPLPGRTLPFGRSSVYGQRTPDDRLRPWRLHLRY